MENIFKNKKILIGLIIGIIVYTIVVIFITINVYKQNLKSNLENAFADAFNNSLIDNGTKDNTADTFKNNSKTINIGELIETKDWELTLIETDYKQDVLPPITNGFYTHYQVEDTDNTYLVVKFTIKNIAEIALTADNNLSLSALYDNKYEYSSFSTLLQKDNAGFDYTNITSISPLTSRTIYYLVEIPKIASEDDKSLIVKLNAYNNEYIYRVK